MQKGFNWLLCGWCQLRYFYPYSDFNILNGIFDMVATQTPEYMIEAVNGGNPSW
jgi:hypothetical protein